MHPAPYGLTTLVLPILILLSGLIEKCYTTGIVFIEVTEATKAERQRKCQQLTGIEIERRVQRLKDAEERKKWRQKYKQGRVERKSMPEPPIGLGN